MDFTVKRLSSNYVEDILEEISLEGLDGITIPTLFERLKVRPCFTFRIDGDSKKFLWNVIVKITDIQFYTIPKLRQTITAEELQYITDDEKAAVGVVEDNVYPTKELQTATEWGSCFYFEERKDVTPETRISSLDAILKQWGCRLVIVAHLRHRMTALCSKELSPDPDEEYISRADYMYLEKIGRSRCRGISCAGPGSLISLGKEPRRVFYHVNSLLKRNIVKKYGSDQNHGMTTTRVFLARFLKMSTYETAAEKFTNRLGAELQTRMNHMMLYSDIGKLFPQLVPKSRKKYLSTEFTKRKIDVNVMVPYKTMFPDAKPTSKMANPDGKMIRCVQLREKQLKTEVDIDVDEEIEDTSTQDLCLDMPILTYAYRMILATGTRGLSHIELQKKIDTSKTGIRNIIKKLQRDKVISAHFVQSGRQRTQMFTISASELKKTVVQSLQKRLMAGANELVVDAATEHSQVDDAPQQTDFTKHADTARKALRMSLITETLKSRGRLLKNDIHHAVQIEEGKRGFKDKMDRRSLMRILNQMLTDNLLKIYNTEVNGVEQNFYVTLDYDPASLPPTPLQIPKAVAPNEIAKHLQEIVLACDRDCTSLLNEDIGLKPEEVKSTESEERLYAPKFLRLSVLHDLVFYLVRGYTGCFEKTHEELLTELKTSVTLDKEIEEELPRLYSDHITCYTFVPPLSYAHSGVQGWCAVGDIILNAPLSSYMKVVKLPTLNAKLAEYLNHPIRKHYPVRMLPPAVRQGFLSSKLVVQVIQDLRRLCFMGLVRFGARPNRRRSYLELFYVNLRASIKDTTLTPQRYLQVESTIPYETIHFYFHSKSDTKAYWVQLFNICLETKLGTRGTASEEVTMVREFQKDILMAATKPVPIEAAEKLDIGQIPGDGLGAGGIDSSLYSFVRTNWVGAPKTVKPLKKIIPFRVNKRVDVKKKRSGAKTKVNVGKKDGKITYDDIDLEAIRMMRTLRVQWSQNEDNILLLSKAAVGYLCPNHRMCARISWSEMRGVLRKHAPESKDKTQRAIARRIIFLLKAEDKSAVVSSVTNVLKNTPDIKKFDSSSLVARIKPTAPDLKELQALLSERFRELVDFMVKRFLEKGLIISFQEAEIPNNMEEMNEQFILEKPTSNKLTMRDINEDSIRAVLLSSLGSVSDKASLATQLFEVYRQYDEALLQSAIMRLHHQKIITLKKRRLHGSPCAMKLMPMRLSPYVFSRGFCFLMSTKYHQSVYHDSYVELNRLLCAPAGQSIELNLSNCGPAVFVLASLGYVELKTATPEQFIVLDTHLVSKETSAKIMKQYAEFANAAVFGESSMSSSKTDKSIKREAVDEPEGQPLAKRQLLCTEPANDGEQSATGEKLVRETVVRVLKRRRSEESEAVLGFRSARLALYTLREIANKEMEFGSNSKPVDLFVVSTSKVICTPTESLVRDFGVCNVRNNKKILSKIASRSDAVRVIQDEVAVFDRLKSTIGPELVETISRVSTFIEAHGSIGITLREILCEFPEKILTDSIRILEEHCLVLRLGLDDVRLVAQKHASAWAVQSYKVVRSSRRNEESVEIERIRKIGEPSHSITEHSSPIKPIMRPWIRIEGSVNRKVIDRFLGTALGQIMIYPGISLHQLTGKFNSALTPSWTRELVNVLVEIGCIVKYVVTSQKPTLFSKGSCSFTDEITGLEPDDKIILEPQIDAIIKLGHFIGNKSYNKDFLDSTPARKPLTKSVK